MLKKTVLFTILILLFNSCGVGGSVEENICCLSAGDRATIDSGDLLVPDGEAEIEVIHCQETNKREIEIIDGSARLIKRTE
jgi:hypothetical protein